MSGILLGGFGVVLGAGIFLMFCGVLLVHILFHKSDKDLVREWAASLPRAERKAYWARERRKKQYLRALKRQHYICMRLRQKHYDETGKDDYWWTAIGIAGERVGMNSFKDVWDAPDRPRAKYAYTGNWGLRLWREPPKKPSFVKWPCPTGRDGEERG